ncbi:MAG: Fic family protein [Thaumarchaeota archaeon]|nr:MAG: Fic family protein [Nitrososphaerota archaeon]
MMNVEVRLVRGRKKYYLAHSYRRAGRPEKVRVFLGYDLSRGELRKRLTTSRVRLKNRADALKQIRDPYTDGLDSYETAELRGLASDSKVRMIHLSEEGWQRFTEAFAYNTNAIEGSTVTDNEVKAVLAGGMWPERPKEEIAETLSVAEAVKYIRNTPEHVSTLLIKELHKIVFGNSKEFAGRFRQRGVEVSVADPLGNVVHRGAPSTQVVPLLRRLERWYEANKDSYQPLVLAAVVHNQFETIHPFKDGNGRVGRLLLINVLLRHGLPPMNIDLRHRGQYHHALEEYQVRGNIRPTIELLVKEYGRLRGIVE